MKFTESLPKPFFILAPMDDVTDVVFRQVIASLAEPDVYFTEFVNVDGLQSPGRPKLLPKLRIGNHESTKRGGKPLIAQIWGKNPENFYKTAQDIVAMGFDGIDINFGCPDKAVVKNDACSAMIQPEHRPQAIDIIKAVQEGSGGTIPVSVKTRLGFNDKDLSWHELLLQQKLNMLTVHLRTKREMSKVPAHWDALHEIVAIKNLVAPQTLIVGNGDVANHAHGLELAQSSGADGIMIGRGIFHDPYAFAESSPWTNMTKQERLDLYASHIDRFIIEWTNNDSPAGDFTLMRPIHTLNKFCKIYIQGFDGAKEMREELMASSSPAELLETVRSFTQQQ